ncbi:hypothetical protein [Mucilaginibacter aquariorum]|uniref:Uncharacterized protein n=1 Tax=Mucilaginibacter aquariorum TaxID=2967225 RepID=A0ABT1SVQ2_9SPHI|nr:hypothetical protein [Mucilaginibacter aquariorum]MCQ6956418.1 hypothetical protein [Mucilaginibacter aquariorum]
MTREHPADIEHALISVKDMPSTFYKVVAENEFNTLSRWIVPETKK